MSRLERLLLAVAISCAAVLIVRECTRGDDARFRCRGYTETTC